MQKTNDWMNTYVSAKDVKVEHFCLTSVGKPRLWFEYLTPIALDWNDLQAQFSQQYSCIGNTHKKLFHTQISFHFDENAEIIDSSNTCTRQVVALLSYGESQVLEVFKNTLPS